MIHTYNTYIYIYIYIYTYDTYIYIYIYTYIHTKFLNNLVFKTQLLNQKIQIFQISLFLLLTMENCKMNTTLVQAQPRARPSDFLYQSCGSCYEPLFGQSRRWYQQTAQQDRLVEVERTRT